MMRGVCLRVLNVKGSELLGLNIQYVVCHLNMLKQPGQ